jgi:hypothetical protein
MRPAGEAALRVSYEVAPRGDVTSSSMGIKITNLESLIDIVPLSRLAEANGLGLVLIDKPLSVLLV